MGRTVIEFTVTPFNGGVVKTYYIVGDPFSDGVLTAIVNIAGGLAVALYFVLLGFFKRPFLILVPVHIMDGIAEVFQMKVLHLQKQL